MRLDSGGVLQMSGDQLRIEVISGQLVLARRDGEVCGPAASAEGVGHEGSGRRPGRGPRQRDGVAGVMSQRDAQRNSVTVPNSRDTLPVDGVGQEQADGLALGGAVLPGSRQGDLDMRPESLGQAKSIGWDENQVFLEGDVLEVAVRDGRWVLTHVPAGPRPAPPPAQHYFPTEE
jgi:hypothetical protein